MVAKKNAGWPGEPFRHGQSARGIPNAPVKVPRNMAKRTMSRAPKVLKKFPSSSSSAIYEVRLAADGIVYCSCPAWRFQKGKTKEERACKHMKMMGLRGDSMMTGAMR